MKVTKLRVGPKHELRVWYNRSEKLWYENVFSEKSGTYLFRECVHSISKEDCLVWTAIIYVKEGWTE